VIWVQKNNLVNILNVFIPFIAVFVLLVLSGGLPTGLAVGYSSIYSGISNPNATGIAAAIATPLILWKLFSVPLVAKRWLWWGLLLFVVYMLLATLSRTAIMVAGITGMGCLLGMGARRIVRYFFSLLLIVLVLCAIFPKVPTSVAFYIYHSIVMKGALENAELNDSFFASRDIPFQEQLRAAKAGGFLGAGYGAQIEVGHFIYINDIQIEIAAGTYKREKGNSAMAIMEEQGMVGLIITFFWLCTFFYSLFKFFGRASLRSERLLLGILTAFLFAMILASMFEAWWVSPGSFESFIFWAVAGIAYGVGAQTSKLRHAS